MSVSELQRTIVNDPALASRIVHRRRIPGREARHASPDFPLHPAVRRMLESAGAARLYRHQAEAVEAVRRGRHVVVTTGTASGKTLCYAVPVLESVLADPASRSLFFFPTKALAQDQLRALSELAGGDPGYRLRAGVYDGDTPPASRARIRRESNIVLTNPDMLHTGILPNHALRHWQFFFENLRFVVIDEIHTYRGIFGSHVANVIRRLRRVCRYYGASPTFICCSATIGNPVALAARLIGESPAAVSEDGSPAAPRDFLFWNPPVSGAMMRRPGVTLEARRILPRAVKEGVRTIMFTRSRMAAEQAADEIRRQLGDEELKKRVTSYRSGYLPEERRRIEQDLASGRLLCVVSTSALELGMDIGGLDLCLLGGYPGSVSATWMRAGRAGRRDAPSMAILVAEDAPLDQYLMNHPEFFFGAAVENAVIDPDNRLVLTAHLRAAAKELPLTPEDVDLFPVLDEVIPQLLDGGELREGRGGFSWAGDEHPAGAVSLRSTSQAGYTIQEEGTGREVGTVEDTAAYLLVHPHAVYLHLGETYFVDRLDLEKRIAFVERKDVGYHTRPATESRIEVVQTLEERALAPSGAPARFGDLQVTTRVSHFRKVRARTHENLGTEPLDLPETTLVTQGVWVVLPRPALDALDRGRIPLPHVVEGLSYLLENTLPLYALCEPGDIRSGAMSVMVEGTLSAEGVSLPHARPAVVVHDLYPGGIGYGRRGYEVLEEWLEAARGIAADCPCRRGCPACVGSEAADKGGVLMALAHLLGAESVDSGAGR